MARQLEGATPEAQISEIIRSRCPLAFGSKFGVSTLAWLPDDSVLLTPGVRVFAAGTLEGYGPLPPEAGALKMRLHGPRNHAVTPPARCQAAPVVLSVLSIAMPNLNPRVADSAHAVGCVVWEEVSAQPPTCTAIHAIETRNSTSQQATVTLYLSLSKVTDSLLCRLPSNELQELLTTKMRAVLRAAALSGAEVQPHPVSATRRDGMCGPGAGDP